MRELSFQEMNHVSGAGITFHAPSEQTVQLIAGASLAWFQTASVVTFLGAGAYTLAYPLTNVALFAAGYAATPHVLNFIDSLLPSPNANAAS